MYLKKPYFFISVRWDFAGAQTEQVGYLIEVPNRSGYIRGISYCAWTWVPHYVLFPTVDIGSSLTSPPPRSSSHSIYQHAI